MRGPDGNAARTGIAGGTLPYSVFAGVFNRFAARCLVALALLGLASTAGRAAELRILALGDSLTAGYGLPAADAFPSQLERALNASGVKAKLINAGVSGDTSAGGLARLDWALNDKPDAVLLCLGANDALRGLDPAAMEANLDRILGRLRARGLPVLLAGMLAPPNMGAEYGRQYNAVFPRLAEKHGTLFYPFFLDGVAAVPVLNQADGMHPNADGVAVIVERILPRVKELAGRRG
jgi:acyl-CoA thioesterase-1